MGELLIKYSKCLRHRHKSSTTRGSLFGLVPSRGGRPTARWAIFANPVKLSLSPGGKDVGFPAKISTKDLARLLGVSVQRINQLAAEGVLAKGGRDQYGTVESVKAYVRFREDAASQEAGRHHGLSRERSQLVRIQRQMAEIELDEKLGNVVLIDDAKAIISRCLLVVKNKLLGLGSKIAPRANPGAPLVAEEAIYAGVVEALTELSTLETYGEPPPPRPGSNGSRRDEAFGTE